MAEKKKRHAEPKPEAAEGHEEQAAEVLEPEVLTPQQEIAKLTAELAEANDKYLRLYAEMENYKKKVRKDREEFLAYCNEDLLFEMLTVIDYLDMALQHAAQGSGDSLNSLKQGVENTLREMNRTLEKFGLKYIEAVGKTFDPAVHHAMSQVERDDLEPGSIVNEMRKGYQYKEKVLRPSMVAVSKKTQE